jgi:hypothetical protein
MIWRKKMDKGTLKQNFSEDFVKVKSALLDIIQNNRNINKNLVQALSTGDFSSIEEYNMMTKGILDASKNITELYQAAPKIVSSIDKDIKEKTPKMSLEDLMDDE